MSENLEKQVGEIGTLAEKRHDDGGSTLLIPEDMASGFHPKHESVREAAAKVDEVRIADRSAIRRYAERVGKEISLFDEPMLLLGDAEARDAVAKDDKASFFGVDR